MKKALKIPVLLFMIVLIVSSCRQVQIDDYSTLVGLYSAEVEAIIGKPDDLKEDEMGDLGEIKVYFYKEILETNSGKKCDLFLYFDGVNTGRFTNDIVGTIDTYSCKMD